MQHLEIRNDDKLNCITTVQKDSMICKPIQLGHISNTNGQANRVYSVKGKTVCLTSQSGGGGAKTGLYKIDLPDGDYYIRPLTPVEAERAQTLPDNYTDGIAKTNRYKCIGNGWNVETIAHIFKTFPLAKINVLSVFDGISCGMVALERAGIKVDRYVAYEIEKNAIKVSEKNYPFIEHCGDVFDGDFTQYKGFDLLIGGSPCQHWSGAKHNRETTPDGIGGQLFMQYVRALKESGCKYFLYENNNSIHSNIKEFISEQLGVEPIMINSALVSAQNRKRCYWTNIPGIVQPEDRGIVAEDILEDGAITWTNKIYCMTATYSKMPNLANTLTHGQRSMVAIPIEEDESNEE